MAKDIAVANFTITPLSGFVDNGNKFTLDWELTTTQTDVLSGFTRIFRYVGDYPPDQISEPDLNDYTVIHETSGLDVMTYDDDLSEYTSEQLSQIFTCKRKLFYAIRGIEWTEAGSFVYLDSFSFIAISNQGSVKATDDLNTVTNTGVMASVKSSKSQVKYNTLYDEGQNVWAAHYGDLGVKWLSRTTIDPNTTRTAFYGGTVWYADRWSSYVLRVKLHNGEVEGRYSIGDGMIRGIAVDPETGDCYAGGSNNTLYKISYSDDTVQQIAHINESIPTFSYGMVHYGGTFYESRFREDGLTGVVNYTWVLNDNGTVNGYKSGATNAGYGITVGADGIVWINKYITEFASAFETHNPIVTETYEISTSDWQASRGICTDFPLTSDIEDYNVYASVGYAQGPWDNRVYKKHWNGSTFDATTIYHRISSVFGVGTDSENNVWCVGDTNKLFKIYSDEIHGTPTNSFPSGGYCTYLNVPYTEWKQPTTSWRELDYVLTRDPTLMTVSAAGAWDTIVESLTTAETKTATVGGDSLSYTVTSWGKRIIGIDDKNRKENAQDWIDTHGAYSFNTSGIRLYPLYDNITNEGLVEIDSEYGAAYQYSDFTGAANSQLSDITDLIEYPSNILSMHPDYISPEITIRFGYVNSTPKLTDGNYWDALAVSNGNNISGYDDLNVRCDISVNTNSFSLTGYHYNFGDRVLDIGGDTNTSVFLNDTEIFNEYTYHDPSKSGKPASRFSGGPGETNGIYSVEVSATGNINCYLVSGVDPNYNVPVSAGATGTVEAWERWPTASQTVIPYDNVALRSSLWSDLTQALSVGVINGIVSGYDPVSAVFNDQSIARTWPLCAWDFTFGDGSSDTYETEDATFAPRDTQTLNNEITSHVYYRVGTYYETMSVRASNTNTESAALDTMNVAVTTEIQVKENPAYANFLVMAVSTVSANYSDDIENPIEDYLSVDQPPVGIMSALISGYAPNLSITFMESSVPHSLPISAYNWNFGNWYSESTMTSAITAGTILTDYPSWTTERTNHMITHTYVMPGVYDVSLCVETSTTSMESCCARNNFVYVEEIPPSNCDIRASRALTGLFTDLSAISGDIGTIYFNLSSLIPGSFPIGIIDWDFGDSTDIERVTRTPFTSIISGATAYPNDITDPRNVFVSHKYTTLDTFDVYTSAYAANTNTYISCSGSIGPFDDFVKLSGKRHLISSRNNEDNILFVFEDELQNKIYNVALSG